MPKISLMKELRPKQEKPPMTKFQSYMCCLAYGFLFMIIFVFVIGGIHPLPGEYLIFQSIDECEALIPEDQSGVKIERYATPDADKDLKGLPYERFFGMQFESDEMEYQIFAYEFETAAESVEYFQKITGKKDDMLTNFSAMSSWGTYRLVVIDGQRAYCVYTTPGQVEKLTQNLKEIFSVNIS